MELRHRKNFLKISVEFGEDMPLKKEEIFVGNNLSEAKRTIIKGDNVTSPGHIEWLRNMARRMIAGGALR